MCSCAALLCDPTTSLPFYKQLAVIGQNKTN